MMYKDRRWMMSAASSAEQLAHLLTEYTWTLCSGFSVAGREEYLFLNDATSEDGAGEYAIVKRLLDGTYRQVESITFSWCDAEQALRYIIDILAGKYDHAVYARPVHPALETPKQHGRCHLCA